MHLGRQLSRRAYLTRLVASCLAVGTVACGTGYAAPILAASGSAVPQPDSAALRIAVVGDSLAGDLADGLTKLSSRKRHIEVVKFTKAATGLIRDDVYDWPAALTGFVRRTRSDAIIAVMGGNDRQSFWLNGRRISRGSAAWTAEYQRRVARVMTILKGTGARIYWVGLPIVQSEPKSAAYREFNQVFRSQAARHGIPYIDTWDAFVDEEGNYTSFGSGPDGVKRRLRKDDGLHFTSDGTVRLAQLVAEIVGRDLKAIRMAR